MKATVKLTIGSRGSDLALWQSEWVKRELEKTFPHLTVELRIMKTTGDKILDSPLSAIGDKGLFTKELEHALLEKKIDLAVHSLKDLPTLLPEGLVLGAVTRREDVRDAFIAHPKKKHLHLTDLPTGARIATGSLRRKCQLLHLRPDLKIVDLRGNLNTRFAKLKNSEWDGMILSRAGVVRLGWEERITEVLPTEMMLPAVGQGALGIEVRESDETVLRYLEPLRSEATTRATFGERALLRYLEGGCQIPIGAFGRIEKNTFFLDAIVGSLDGTTVVRGKIHGPPNEAETLGSDLAASLYASGAGEILENIRSGG